MNHSSRLLTFLLLSSVISNLACKPKESLAVRLAEQRKKADAAKPSSGEAFMLAAGSGDLQQTALQLAKGVDVDYRDDEQHSALHLAAFEGHYAVVGLLIQHGADVNAIDGMGRTPLMFAASGPYPRTVQYLLDAGAEVDSVDNDEQFTALMFAAAEGQLENVKLLAAAGADRNRKDIDGENAIDFAKANGHTEVVQWLMSPK